MYIDGSIKKYVDDLAGSKPAPGGGSAAAFSGMLGAALLEMVCNFTIGKDKYKDFEPEIRDYLARLKKFRDGFANLVDEDVKTYSQIRDAFRTKDKKVIDIALKNGYDICLKICRLSKEALSIAKELPQKGNSNLVTDVGCGAEFLNAAFNSSMFNALINLKSIEDKGFAEKEREVLEKLKEEAGGLYKGTLMKTEERLR